MNHILLYTSVESFVVTWFLHIASLVHHANLLQQNSILWWLVLVLRGFQDYV